MKIQRINRATLKDYGKGGHVSIRRNKYNNKKTKYDGILFDSIKEFNRYKELKLLLKAKKIKDLKVHEPYILQIGFIDFEGKKQREIKYISDFFYIQNGKEVVEDVKSKATKTNAYRIKKKMFLYSYRDIVFREI